jgi:hypothetical protein
MVGLWDGSDVVPSEKRKLKRARPHLLDRWEATMLPHGRGERIVHSFPTRRIKQR